MESIMEHRFRDNLRMLERCASPASLERQLRPALSGSVGTWPTDLHFICADPQLR